jgi:multidrug efflux pump subunit AcrA (membrane-fusion protein)
MINLICQPKRLMKHVGAGLLLVAWSQAFGGEKPSVSVEKVKNEDIFDLYYLPVSLQAVEESLILADIDGIIAELPVKLGASVKKDDLLVVIRQLKSEIYHSPIQIKSPINGQIASVKAKVGGRVNAGDTLLQVVNPAKLAMLCEIPQKDLASFSAGSSGDIAFRVLSPKLLPVVISGVSPLVSALTGTSSCELSWDTKKLSEVDRHAISKQLFPGMVGTVEFKLAQRVGISVPDQALSFEKQSFLTRVVVDGKIKKRPVTIGKDLAGDRKEIISGLAVGETLVVSRSTYLKENEEVTIQESEQH